jgi:hypothetical protein
MRVLDAVNFGVAEEMSRAIAPGDHCVALTEDADDAERVACSFIEDGLRAGDRVLSWVSADLCPRIEQRLADEDLSRLRIVDSATVYKAPFDGAATVERVVEIARAEPTPLRIVGGPSGDPTKIAPFEEWERYEQVVHAACVDNGIPALCVYEARELPVEMLEMFRRAHPLIDRHDAMHRNPDFVWAG